MKIALHSGKNAGFTCLDASIMPRMGSSHISLLDNNGYSPSEAVAVR